MVNLKEVRFGYRRKPPLFDGLDVSLEPGSIYGLLGRNGAGKTTMLKLVCGLLFPHGGSVSVLGADPAERAPATQMELLLVPEEFVTPALTAVQYEQIYGAFYPRFDASEFRAHLQEFEVEPDENLSQMSYGQKKKVLLAFGLAAHTRVLLLDEPTNGLDIPSKGQFRRLLAGSEDEQRVTIISTHQVRDMENLIDPVIILENGKVVFQQSMDEITSRIRVQVGAEQPADAIYSERALGGFASILPNLDGRDSHVDLELLFNAVTSNPGAFHALKTKEGV
jgi:ABC-2 type transport system ATP-binding protein